MSLLLDHSLENKLNFIPTVLSIRKLFFFAIIGAEYILKWLPIGTHNWEKFLTPNELEIIAKKNDFLPDEIVGMKFNLYSKKWHKSNDHSVNYISTFLKN